MKKELALGAALLLGGGGTVEAQSPEPSPETLKNLSTFIEGVDKFVDGSKDPEFFAKMEERSQAPDNYKDFTYEKQGIQETWMYFPDGELRVIYQKEVDNVLNPETNQPDRFVTTEIVDLKLGSEGNLTSPLQVGRIPDEDTYEAYFDTAPHLDTPEDFIANGPTDGFVRRINTDGNLSVIEARTTNGEIILMSVLTEDVQIMSDEVVK